jgi:hypothetical protein
MLENTNDKHKTGNHFMSRSCFRQKPTDHSGIMVGADDNMHQVDVCQEKNVIGMRAAVRRITLFGFVL